MIHALVIGDGDAGRQDGEAGALAQWLTSASAIEATTTTLVDLGRGAQTLATGDAQVVIADTCESPTHEQARALRAFVAGGGGLFCLGATVDSWLRADPSLADLLGFPLDPTMDDAASAIRRTPPTELIVRVAGDHDTTRRLDTEFTLHATIPQFTYAPADATPLLTVSWRYATISVAYVRRCGEGQVIVCTLADTTEGGVGADNADGALWVHPVLRQFLFRAMRYAAGWREGAALNVALIGYGAIGREHGEAIERTPGLTLAVVCDRNPARLLAARERFPQAQTVAELDAIMDDPSVAVAIVGTPPNTHAALARQLLLAGKHVVVEKPFCLTTAEADELVRLAEERDLTLTVYQNRRWDPDFQAIQQVVRAGTIGEVFHVETFIGGFAHPCDFWHSHEPVSGGVFYDWGSHYLDWILTLLPGEVSAVRASAHKRVWLDVTNADQASLSLRFADGCEASFIHSDVAAALKPKWYILGTRGAIVADWRHTTVTSRKWTGDLIEEPLAPSEALPIVTVSIRAADGRIAEQRLSLPAAPRDPFHRNLADHLLAGEPLAVRPRSSRRNIAVMEAAAHSAVHDAEIVRPAPAASADASADVSADIGERTDVAVASNGHKPGGANGANGATPEAPNGVAKGKRNGART